MEPPTPDEIDWLITPLKTIGGWVTAFSGWIAAFLAGRRVSKYEDRFEAVEHKVKTLEEKSASYLTEESCELKQKLYKEQAGSILRTEINDLREDLKKDITELKIDVGTLLGMAEARRKGDRHENS
jgi:NTP pyrophosphatase (non-canonical NTP hydrolase)